MKDCVAGMLWMCPLHLECIVPGHLWMDLPISMWRLASNLLPFFFYFQSIDERASLNRDTGMIAGLCVYLHRKVQTNESGPMPFLFNAIIGARLHWFLPTILQNNMSTFSPGGNT